MTFALPLSLSSSVDRLDQVPADTGLRLCITHKHGRPGAWIHLQRWHFYSWKLPGLHVLFARTCLDFFLFLRLILGMFMRSFSNQCCWKFICSGRPWPSFLVWFTSGSRRGLPTAPSRPVTGGGWVRCASSSAACVHVWSSPVSFSSEWLCTFLMQNVQKWFNYWMVFLTCCCFSGCPAQHRPPLWGRYMWMGFGHVLLCTVRGLCGWVQTHWLPQAHRTEGGHETIQWCQWGLDIAGNSLKAADFLM